MDIKGVTESAVRRIREEIITGILPAGSRLHEAEFSARFGISRPPLREAFRILANENLAVSIPRKGSFVAAMSPEDCEQIYRARQMLECTAVDILRQERATALPALRNALELAWSLPEPCSVIERFYAMSRFHLRLIECAGNRWITHCYQGLRSSLARYQVMYLNLSGSNPTSLDEHEWILSLLENGEYAQAKHHLAAHLDRTRQCLRENMADERPARDSGQVCSGGYGQ